MSMIRTTLLLDALLVQRVRQQFNGNVSKGVNVLLKEHLRESQSRSMAGFLAGKVSLSDLEEDEGLEKDWDSEHSKLHDRLLKGKGK